MPIRFIITLLFVITVRESLPAQDNYRIFYNVLEDREKDNYDIYSMNMDGTGKKNVTGTPGVEWVYYAYRDKVYYLSDADTCHRCLFLYEMNSDGNNKRRVSDLQMEDSWMGSRKNGTEMIVSGRQGALRNQLFLVNIKTGKYTQLTNDTVVTMRDPIFLPGGKEIVLAFRPDKKMRKTIPEELWKMDLSMNNKMPLTSFPLSDTTTAWFEYHAGPPQWNKNGFISYISRQQGQTQIYLTMPDPLKGWSDPRRDQITSGELSSGWHSWSSDGNWLAMDKSTHDGKKFDIYLMNYRTREISRLTDSEKTEQAPVIAEIRR